MVLEDDNMIDPVLMTQQKLRFNYENIFYI